MRGDILTVGLAFAALDGPVVITVIVDRAVSVEQKPVLAVLEREATVGAQEEGPAVLGVSVSVNSVRVGTRRGAEQGGSLGCGPRKSINGLTTTSSLRPVF